MTDWGVLAVAALGIASLSAIKRLSWISTRWAQSCLKEGAVLVDVRTPAEFRARHVTGALNIPLGNLRDAAPRELPDKQRVVLLHCLSGTRSGVARRELKSLGYKNVYNLGSLGRAQRIIQTPHH